MLKLLSGFVHNVRRLRVEFIWTFIMCGGSWLKVDFKWDESGMKVGSKVYKSIKMTG